ncbi:NAD(P)/FAD-dependent oxidoreductase [Arsenicicoccus dermatophilus]|uniref:NAD(P)/FAD-dependent oxidoreductase n=1 Tax=Arsenicicoccus dermatophilus TaxID=1076331 RepID=UPI001F4C6253|nr:FAD/NAD(P)-binding oxidoreductase [Arsenicicoccus dermatophilus]MCH8611853.1 NAD(P)/FAD-dependent oxidoreductase [Arsenicicoccus dermatophilus]
MSHDSSRAYTIVIVGAGTAGATVAARLRRAGARDVALVDPDDWHYYQPLWTLAGGGRADVQDSRRPRSGLVPRGVSWIQDAAVGVDPERRTVQLRDGGEVSYRQLVMAPGLQLDWTKIPGLAQTIGSNGTSSNYRFDLAPRTWDLIRATRSGTAVFAMPSGPIKCAGAPQKIAYLAADHWRREGVLGDIDVHLVLPMPGMFGIPKFAQILADTAAGYGITVHLSSEISSVDGPGRTVTIRSLVTGRTSEIEYTMAHLVPPQSAPDWVKSSALADPSDPGGYVDVDQHTLQHRRYPDVFALGDVAGTPSSKTGAAVRHQAPVVVRNMLDAWRGRELTGRYDGYASCPLTLSHRRLLLAEFDYSMQPAPSNPLPWPDTTEPLVDFNQLKKTGLPLMYWHGMLRGLV